MMRELTEMQRLSGASALALEMQTKKNQQLQHKIALMQNSIDTLLSQRDTAEAQIKRLLDLLERTQAQVDSAMALVNVARQSRGRLVWAFKRMKQAAKHWSEAHSRELARAERMRAVVDAARVLCDELYPNRAGNDRHCGCIECTLVAALAAFAAQREAKP